MRRTRVEMEPKIQITRQRLHDRLCQQLTGAAMFAQVLASELESRSDPVAEQARKLQELIGSAVDEVVSIMSESREGA